VGGKTLLAAAAALVLGAAAGARQDGAAFEKARAEAVAGLVGRLEELAEWCATKKAFAAREETYHTILRFDAEHAGAHRGLGHTKDKQGVWSEAHNRAAPADYDKAALKEVPGRRDAAVRPFCERVHALLDEHAEALARERVLAAQDEILLLAPDDPRVRAARGEARVEERWVLIETATAKQRRGELKDLVRAAFERTPEPTSSAPTEAERALGPAFGDAASTPVVRVLATGARTEAVTAAKALHAGRDFFNHGLNASADYHPAFRVFLLALGGEKEALLANHPALDERARGFLRPLVAGGIEGTGDVAHWGGEEAQRLDGASRIALGFLFTAAFGITSDHGWAYEGFGLYMTRELIGTRLTWFVQPSQYLRPADDRALRARLLLPGTNWINEANNVLQGDRRPKLSFVMGKTVNNLTTEDLLFSYVTAAYLLEGRPKETPELLRRVGAGTAPQQAVEDVLGMNVMELDARVRRWLTERR